MLGSSGAVGGRFLAVTFVKAIDASCGIDQLLLTREERMAGRTDFDVQVALAGRAGLERLAAGAANGYFVIFGVNSWFHYSSSLSKRRNCRIFKHDMIGACPCSRQVPPTKAVKTTKAQSTKAALYL